MPDRKQDRELELGVFGRPARRGLGAAEVIALVLSGLWLVACLVFFLVLGGAGPEASDSLRFVMVLLAVALPVAVIWLAASAGRSARVMREESGRLQAALTAMRQSFLDAQHAHILGPRPSDLTEKLEEIAEKQKQTESALATFVSTRRRLENRLQPKQATPPEGSSSDAETGQASLALGTPLEALTVQVEIDDVIRAVNFPENAEDEDGFAALRRALGDRKVATLIQAAQDVLTLLSQDGIFMDDLRPDRARPEVWRQFALGDRGRAVAALGGVRDRSSLALSAGRMRHDPVFRDAVHHFLRRFDEMLTSVEPRMNDEEIARLGDTRTARAFMLLGRATHTFD